MRRAVDLLVLVCACTLASSALAGPAINLDKTIAEVSNASTKSTDSHDNTLGVLASANLPGYSSNVTSAYTAASFSATLEQTRGAFVDGYSYGEVQVEFTPDANTFYVASGAYSNSGGRTSLLNYLFDITASTTLFYSEQISENAPATFAVGGLAANKTNNLVGSLTGSLVAGHNYRWYGQAFSRVLTISDGNATPSGNLSLTLSAVPEPCSVVLSTVLTLIVGARCRRKRF